MYKLRCSLTELERRKKIRRNQAMLEFTIRDYWRVLWEKTVSFTYCSSDAWFLLLKYGGAAAVPPSVLLNGNGRSPRNPSSIHCTLLMKSGTKNDDGYRCHSLPTHRTEPDIGINPTKNSSVIAKFLTMNFVPICPMANYYSRNKSEMWSSLVLT